jgi:pimeloyl-ACP methyl ester carboxylesterase
MKTFVLVHGAWHSNFIWDEVEKQLVMLGHKVYKPNLPGHGNNYRNFTDITLQSYLSEIEKVILQHESLILVGHSMAGIIISQLAENFPEKIEKLIYLTAFVPDNNGSLFDEEQKAIKPSVALEVTIDKEKSSIFVKNSPNFKELFYNNCLDELYQDIFLQIGDQPLQPFLDKVQLTDEKFGRINKLYIECLQDKAIAIEDQRRMQQKIACEVTSLNSDHSPFVTDCNNLVKILAGV